MGVQVLANPFLETFREGTQLLTSQLESQMWPPIPPANFSKNAATWHLIRLRETEISLGAWTLYPAGRHGDSPFRLPHSQG